MIMKNSILITIFFLIVMSLKAKEYYGAITIDELNVEVTLNDSTKKAIIKMIGPSKAWFAIGFGSKNMNETYAIFANESGKKNIAERILSIDSITYLTNEIAIKDYSIDSENKVTYIIERSLISDNGGYSFNAQSGEIDIILAIGSNPNFGTYHGSNRSSTSINLIELNSINDKKEIENKFLKIYPNPGKDILNIDWKNKAELTDIKIIMGNGTTINSYTAEQTNHKSIDVSSFVPGTYFVSIKNNDWNSYFTFFKK